MKKLPRLTPVFAAAAWMASATLFAQTAPATAAASATPAATSTAPASTPAAVAAPASIAPAVAPVAAPAAVEQSSYKFSFTAQDAPAGFDKVTPDMTYSDARGYGFEPGAVVNLVPKDKSGKDTSSVLTSAQPFYFSAAVPEGNYRVTVTFGNPDAASDNTVKAELRRLMLESVPTKPGEYVTKTFMVNVRRPEIVVNGQVTGEVRLKTPRENGTEGWAWDNKLTLEFNGDHPSIAALSIEKVEHVPTVFVIGDSTSCDQPTEPYNSWGQMLPRFLKPDVAVANHGESGETIGDNIGRRRFEKIWSVMQPGDYVFVTSGHNERSGKNGNMDFDQAFYDDFKQVVDKTRQLGGIPVLVTPISRAPGSASLGPYPGELRQLATDDKVPLIDLNTMTATFYQSLGDNYRVAFKTGDATHNSNYGSYEVAKMVVLGIKQNKLDLAKSIVDDYQDIDPSKPDDAAAFKVPASPRVDLTKPAGS
jgi:lysophospholipase L1-like esterase